MENVNLTALEAKKIADLYNYEQATDVNLLNYVLEKIKEKASNGRYYCMVLKEPFVKEINIGNINCQTSAKMKFIMKSLIDMGYVVAGDQIKGGSNRGDWVEHVLKISWEK